MVAATKTRKKPDEQQQPPAERPPDPAAAPAPTQGQAAPEAPEVSGPDLDAIAAALAAPFDPCEIKFKPQTISGNRALAVPYVDARVVMDRLDDVLGVLGWQDSYEVMADGAVVCRLQVRAGGEWITKTDVGGESEQPDEGDRRKAAFSDSLKRAAVKLGIGRYLYRQKPQWCDWDPQKRQFVRPPALPLHAAGRPAQPAAQARTYDEAAAREEKQPAATSSDFHRQLQQYDGKLAGDGLCSVGDLVKAVAAAGKRDGFPADLTAWDAAQIERARAVTKDFVERAGLRADVDRLMAAKNAQLGAVLDKVATRFEMKGTPSLMALSAVQLQYAVARLSEMPDAEKDRKAS